MTNFGLAFKSATKQSRTPSETRESSKEKARNLWCRSTLSAIYFHNNLLAGVDLLFKILRKTAELRSSDIAKYRYEGRDKANTMGFSQIFKMLKEKGELGDEEQDDDVSSSQQYRSGS